MWLLNTTTRKLHNFLNNDIPAYVILSHTWGEDEVSFDEIDQPHASMKAGYGKIVGCCRLAANDGFHWAWIDTCSIDKRSSAELSEAINSMYKWYWEAAICYVYLSDVDSGCKGGISSIFEKEGRTKPFERGERRYSFERSRWFTRGWTLQELLAPEVVEFYDAQWTPLGTKVKLVHEIAKITRIEPSFILDRETIKAAIISTKFGWMAFRETTREEDMAYCMLGIMHVNMPMLYGEGRRAFYRLQLEIIKQTNDHSIFAWETERRTGSILASSPSFFQDSMSVQPAYSREPSEITTYEITNNGLRIELPVVRVDQDRSVAMLDCMDQRGYLIGFEFQSTKDGNHQRVPGSKLRTMTTEQVVEPRLLTLYLVVQFDHGRNTSRPVELAFGDMMTNGLCYIDGTTVGMQHATMNFGNAIPAPTWFNHGHFSKSTVARAMSSQHQIEYLLRHLTIQHGEVVCFQMQVQQPSYHSRRVVIVVGLRNRQPVIDVVPSDEYFRMFSDHKKKADTLLRSDFIRDHVSMRWKSGDTVQVDAKREKRGQWLRWTLTINFSCCGCGYHPRRVVLPCTRAPMCSQRASITS